MGKRKELVCCGCGIIRIGEIWPDETEKECHVTARRFCQACGCPYVETRGKALEE